MIDRTPLAPPSPAVYAAARARSDGQAKPVGALGRLEELAAWIAACQGECPPRPLDDVRVVVFAGDHGITAHGVSAYPASITPVMVRGFLAGAGGVNVLAAANDVAVSVYDLGVDDDLAGVPDAVRAHRVGPSRAFHLTDALTPDELRRALAAGDAIAAAEVDAGAQLLMAGDLGIGNTTPAAALIAATYGVPAAEVTGRGTGIDDATLARKIELIDAGIARLGERNADPLERLAALGSADFAAADGFMIGSARRGVPVLVDGVIAAAEAVLAEALVPGVKAWMRAGHQSTEPGSSFALQRLGLVPLVDLQLRLGEGTGAVLAVPIVRAAVAVLRDMAQLSDLMGNE